MIVFWCIHVAKHEEMKMLMLLFAFLLHFEMSVSNEWSECSRSCGTGISYKTVSCRRFIDDCFGKKEEYRVCKKKECPDNTTDYRTQQCQEIEEHLVSLSDSTDNSCHVKCGLPGGLPIKSVIAKDGTPCSVSGVCIAGTCVPVGCDGILGSDKRMDKCGRCGATDGVCLHVPCNITKMDEQENAYHVRLLSKSTNIKLLISSSACNILATNKNQTYSFKEISVVTISGNKLELDANVLTSHGPLHEEISIQIQHCQAYEIECKYHIPVYKYTYTSTIYAAQSFDEHEWVIGENYTACSRTCGNGIQRKKVYCRHIETQQRVGDSSCDSETKPDFYIRDCVMSECPYIWDIGEWESCSKSCGGGIRKRAVACVLRRNGSVSVNETACSGPKPVHREHCNQHLCYNHWHKGKYNECSADCGKGQRIREVFCLNAHGMKINDSYCNIAKKHEEVDDCMGDMCSYRWVRSNWSKCFLENGVRIQTRIVECRRVIDNALVNGSICERNISRSKPKTRRPCPCIKTWGYDEWRECQVTDCNKKGTQYRGIYCYCEDTLTTVDGCDMSNKPPTEQACTTTDPCPADWVVGLPYTKCNYDSCSKEGTLKCMKQNIEVDKKLCPIYKPDKIVECDNCTVPVPVPVCAETDPLRLCKQFDSNYLENNQDAKNYCYKHCCLCKNMST